MYLEDNLGLVLAISLLAIVLGLAAVTAQVGEVRDALRATLDYEADADMCWQSASDDEVCKVDLNAEGEYYWYRVKKDDEYGIQK